MFAFDQNGKFVKWSDLFDLSSPEMLKASLKLPLPTGKFFTENDVKVDDNGVNLEDYVAGDSTDLTKPIIILNNTLKVRLDTPQALYAYGELIHKLTSNNFTITQSIANQHLTKWLLPKVNKYNSYLQNIKNSKQRIDAIKNNIEAQIYSIILNPKNQIEAQCSVDSSTKPFKDLAAMSPRAEDSNRSTPLKFTSNIHAISDNSVGKQGIGISAVGMKSYFAATQYFNWVVKHGTDKQKKNLQFNVEILSPDGHSTIYTQLSNVEGLEHSENWNYTDFAVYLSALLSLSTDNAKELALNKLNCDNNTMGMWLYGLTIGMAPKDIYNIMTSDIAFEIAKLARSNIFINQDGMSINRVIKFIENGPQITTNTTWSYILNVLGVSYIDAKKQGANLFTSDILSTLYKLQDSVKQNDKLQKDNKQQILNTIDSILTFIRIKSNLNTSEIAFTNFKTLYKGADELKTLGQILHLNQGLYTSDLDTLKIISRIENIITDRAHAIGYSGDTEKFDLHRFLYDQQYQEAIIDDYNKVKVSFNILDLITKVPHYYEYLKVLDLQDKMYSTISSKYRTIKTLGRIIINKSGAYLQSDKDTIYKRIKQYADNQILQNWFLESDAFGTDGIQIEIPKGAEYFLTTKDGPTKNLIESGNSYTDIFGETYTVGTFNGMKVNLGTADGRATFKLWMETQVIPNLKNGNNGIQTNGKYIPEPLNPLNNNKFIQSLTPTVYTKTPMNTVITGYCPNINMSPQTDLDMEIFQSYKNAFNKLDTYGQYSIYHSGLATYKISDLLFLYNLITYQNNLGENTLTKIFEDKYDSPLIRNYMQYINQFDRTKDFVLDIDSINFEDPEILAQLLPKANKNTTKLNQFVSIDNITGDIQILTKNYDKTSEERFNVLPVLNNNYYPTTDSQKVTININNANISDENKTAHILNKNGKEQIINIDNISIDHMNGTILQIRVNGNIIHIEDKYKQYFKHIPTKQVITNEGNNITVYDKDQLIDDIITLISKEC